jgi:hypothetical protein
MRALTLAAALLAAGATFANPGREAAAADCSLAQNARLAECANRNTQQSNRGGDVRGGARADEAQQFGNNTNTGNGNGNSTRNTTRGNRTNARTNTGGDQRGGNRSNEVQQLNDLNQATPGPGPGTGRVTTGHGHGH